MKIRVATIMWQDGFGGAERSLRDVAVALDPNFIEMRFYFLSGSGNVFTDEIASFGHVVEFLHWKNGFSLFGRLRLLLKLVQFKPMIVHEHFIPLFVRPLIKLFLNCAILHTEHGIATYKIMERGRLRQVLTSYDLRYCDLVLANSKASKDALIQAFRHPIENVRIIYLGIDLTNFVIQPKINTDSGKKFVGFVGRIRNLEKGVDYLPAVARAILALGRTDVEFIILGDGPDRMKLEKLCEQLGVSHLFTFLGFQKDVAAIVGSFDVLLMPSRMEAFGLAAIEALACNVPVVAFDVGGLNEAIGECPIARLVPFGDVDAMARTVVEYLNMSKEKISGGREYAIRHFSNQRMVSELMEIYSRYVFQD